MTQSLTNPDDNPWAAPTVDPRPGRRVGEPGPVYLAAAGCLAVFLGALTFGVTCFGIAILSYSPRGDSSVLMMFGIAVGTVAAIAIATLVFRGLTRVQSSTDADNVVPTSFSADDTDSTTST